MSIDLLIPPFHPAHDIVPFPPPFPFPTPLLMSRDPDALPPHRTSTSAAEHANQTVPAKPPRRRQNLLPRAQPRPRVHFVHDAHSSTSPFAPQPPLPQPSPPPLASPTFALGEPLSAPSSPSHTSGLGGVGAHPVPETQMQVYPLPVTNGRAYSHPNTSHEPEGPAWVYAFDAVAFVGTDRQEGVHVGDDGAQAQMETRTWTTDCDGGAVGGAAVLQEGEMSGRGGGTTRESRSHEENIRAEHAGGGSSSVQAQARNVKSKHNTKTKKKAKTKVKHAAEEKGSQKGNDQGQDGPSSYLPRPTPQAQDQGRGDEDARGAGELVEDGSCPLPASHLHLHPHICSSRTHPHPQLQSQPHPQLQPLSLSHSPRSPSMVSGEPKAPASPWLTHQHPRPRTSARIRLKRKRKATEEAEMEAEADRHESKTRQGDSPGVDGGDENAGPVRLGKRSAGQDEEKRIAEHENGNKEQKGRKKRKRARREPLSPAKGHTNARNGGGNARHEGESTGTMAVDHACANDSAVSTCARAMMQRSPAEHWQGDGGTVGTGLEGHRRERSTTASRTSTESGYTYEHRVLEPAVATTRIDAPWGGSYLGPFETLMPARAEVSTSSLGPNGVEVHLQDFEDAPERAQTGLFTLGQASEEARVQVQVQDRNQSYVQAYVQNHSDTLFSAHTLAQAQAQAQAPVQVQSQPQPQIRPPPPFPPGIWPPTCTQSLDRSLPEIQPDADFAGFGPDPASFRDEVRVWGGAVGDGDGFLSSPGVMDTTSSEDVSVDVVRRRTIAPMPEHMSERGEEYVGMDVGSTLAHGSWSGKLRFGIDVQASIGNAHIATSTSPIRAGVHHQTGVPTPQVWQGRMQDFEAGLQLDLGAERGSALGLNLGFGHPYGGAQNFAPGSLLWDGAVSRLRSLPMSRLYPVESTISTSDALRESAADTLPSLTPAPARVPSLVPVAFPPPPLSQDTYLPSLDLVTVALPQTQIPVGTSPETVAVSSTQNLHGCPHVPTFAPPPHAPVQHTIPLPPLMPSAMEAPVAEYTPIPAPPWHVFDHTQHQVPLPQSDQVVYGAPPPPMCVAPATAADWRTTFRSVKEAGGLRPAPVRRGVAMLNMFHGAGACADAEAGGIISERDAAVERSHAQGGGEGGTRGIAGYGARIGQGTSPADSIDVDQLSEGVAGQHTDRVHRCPFCPRVFRLPNGLAIHLKWHWGESALEWKRGIGRMGKNGERAREEAVARARAAARNVVEERRGSSVDNDHSSLPSSSSSSFYPSRTPSAASSSTSFAMPIVALATPRAGFGFSSGFSFPHSSGPPAKRPPQCSSDHSTTSAGPSFVPPPSPIQAVRGPFALAFGSPEVEISARGRSISGATSLFGSEGGPGLSPTLRFEGGADRLGLLDEEGRRQREPSWSEGLFGPGGDEHEEVEFQDEQHLAVWSGIPSMAVGEYALGPGVDKDATTMVSHGLNVGFHELGLDPGLSPLTNFADLQLLPQT